MKHLSADSLNAGESVASLRTEYKRARYLCGYEGYDSGRIRHVYGGAKRVEEIALA